MREGKSFKIAITEAGKGKAIKSLETASQPIFFSQKPKEVLKPAEMKPPDEATIEAIRIKIQKPVLGVNIRMVGVAREQWRAEEILHY